MDTEQTPPMRVLVSADSKHGATNEIAERIGIVLEKAGYEVTVLAPRQVTDASAYDAIVLGSAVYAGHWMTAAKDLAELVGELDPPVPVWLFSSGPLGVPPKPDEDPVDMAGILAVVPARDHHVFSGKIDKSKLSFAEKALVVAVRAPEGDFRDWDEIENWAREIPTALRTAPT